ncbi:unnamed protein product [Merluccius merluccius]
MSGADSHSACIRCLGLEHAKAALAFPTCEQCVRFSHKTHKRQLNKQAKLFAEDPIMGVTDPPLPELAGGSRGRAGPPGTSWGSAVDLTEASQPLELTQPDTIEASLLAGPDEAEGGNSESGEESISLSSDEDKDDDPFSPCTASPMVDRMRSYLCLQRSYLCLQGGYLCLQGDYHCLQEDYLCLQRSYICLQGDYHCLQEDYLCLQGGYKAWRQRGEEQRRQQSAMLPNHQLSLNMPHLK